MTPKLELISLILLMSTCTISRQIFDKIKYNGHCVECVQYINQKLIPQLESCANDIDDYEDCKFDRKEFEKHGSCFLGMKKGVLENLIGTDFGYKVNDRAQYVTLFWFKYNSTNNRLIEIVNVDALNMKNSNLACLECEKVYEQIRNGKRLKKMNFTEFHELYKGCFYGKSPSQLIPKLELRNRIEENLKHYSYNKPLILGRYTLS